MKIIHGTWIPSAATDFLQKGAFYLWVETPIAKKRRNVTQRFHPNHLAKTELEAFLIDELGIKPAPYSKSDNISTQYFALPTANNQPLPLALPPSHGGKLCNERCGMNSRIIKVRPLTYTYHR